MLLFYQTLISKITQLYNFLKFFYFIYITFKLSILSNYFEYFKNNNTYYILFSFIFLLILFANFNF